MDEAHEVAALIRARADRFVAALHDLTPAQWAHQPAGGGWSGSEVAEHVAKAGQGILTGVTGGLAPRTGDPVSVTDDEIPYLFYRGDEPPHVAPPTGTWHDLAAAERALVDGAGALGAWAEAGTVDLRTLALRHPAFGLMDGVQWLLFAAAHLERHRSQLIRLQRPAATAG